MQDQAPEFGGGGSNEQSADRRRIASNIVARLNQLGIPATLSAAGKLDDLIRGHAEQLLEAASRCQDPELRAQMVEMATMALSKSAKNN